MATQRHLARTKQSFYDINNAGYGHFILNVIKILHVHVYCHDEFLYLQVLYTT